MGLGECEGPRASPRRPVRPPRFLFKGRKTPFAPPPAVPTVPRLEEDVVPDERDDPEVIMNTTTVGIPPCPSL